MLFVLYLIAISFLLNKFEGYLVGKTRKLRHMDNIFVDNLKLHTQSLGSTKKQLHNIKTFSRDVNTQFGEHKCAYLQIGKGKMMQNLQLISINDLTIKPVEVGDNWKYLRIDDSINK